MANSNHYPKQESPVPSSLVDDYFELTTRGPERYTAVVWQTWQALSPAERHTLQKTASEMAGGNLIQSELFAQSFLALEYVNQEARAASASDDDVSSLPPVA